MYIPAIIGAGTLLADGIITPPISVSSAVEGLRMINPEIPVIPIVILIITLLFAFQRFGTKVVGSSFGPIMLLWFSMLIILGLKEVVNAPSVFKAINPIYAYNFLMDYPEGF